MAAAFQQRVETPLRQALDMAKLDLDAIESVILHGGVVRTPLVQKALETVVGKSHKLKTNVQRRRSGGIRGCLQGCQHEPKLSRQRDPDERSSADACYRFI